MAAPDDPMTQPRRAKRRDEVASNAKQPRRNWGTDFLLITLCFAAGLIGAYLGNALASM